MNQINCKTIILLLAVFFTSTFYPTISGAIVIVPSYLASGHIIQKHNDNSVSLDDGKFYRPSHEGLVITVMVGEPITLRYTVNTDGQKIFSEFAPGVNSLQPLPKFESVSPPPM